MCDPPGQQPVADPQCRFGLGGPFEHRAHTEEPSHERVRRIAPDGLGLPLLQDAALMHDDQSIGEDQGLALVVGHVDRGDTELPLDPAELQLHLLFQ